MGGSQLNQLKAALNGAGLSRTSGGGKNKNKKTRSNGQSAKDRMAGDAEARQRKLQSISQSMNKFDVKTTKTKHQVLGAKPLKGATGRPGLSKQAGIENRRKMLLPQLMDRNRTGGVVDRRFGENDPSMTPEERALQRFTAERQRKASKQSMFNLDDDEEDMLTHYGKSLADTPQPLADQEELFQRATARDQDQEAEPGRKKSKAEVMEEIIAKSKAYKHERQKVKNQDEELRLQLDDDISAIRGLLGAANEREQPHARGSRPPRTRPLSPTPQQEEAQLRRKEDAPVASTSNLSITFVKHGEEDQPKVDRDLLSKLIGDDDEEEESDSEDDDEPSRGQPENEDDVLATLKRRKPPQEDEEDGAGDDPYDRFVRELAFDKRANPSDRLKSELELAQEAAAALEKSERARLKRMRGESDTEAEESDEEDGDEEPRKKRKGKQRAPQGDDLGDDFDLEGDEVNGFGLGQGLMAHDAQSSAGSDQEDGADDEDVGENDEEVEEEDEDEDTGSEKEENEMLADLLHGSDVEGDDEDDEDDEDESEPATSKASRSSAKPSKADKSQRDTGKKELPYTFPCPSTHVEFLDLIEGTDESDLPVIIQRIRTLYHPSLAEGNKQKLAVFLTVLLDHLIYLPARPDDPSFKHTETLLMHILQMAPSFPISTATYSKNKLALMQKNLVRGLQAGALLESSRTWPGAGELTLLRVIGLIWSTSDFSHPVVMPAMLLIGQYLGQCRVRSLGDLASGLFLCTLVLQYEQLSKRIVPETINFLAQAAILLLPTTFKNDRIPGNCPMPDGQRADLSSLKCPKKLAADLSQPLDLLGALQATTDKEISAKLAFLTLSLVGEYAALHTALPAFIEVFEPLEKILHGVLLNAVPATIPKKIDTTRDSLSRMLKFSRQARRPLALQGHKPIPIPTYLPKFEEGYKPGKHFDPDSERNEAAKLKALVRKEKKGAIRELRKDARFLGAEKARMQKQKDEEYRTKINRITAGLEQERNEEKKYERAKDRAKSRDKKRAGGKK